MATEKELQKASEDNLAALTKKNKLITESNKVLSSVTKLETQIENSKKEELSVSQSITDELKSTRDGILGGAESMVTGLFGGAVGGLINTLTIGRYKRKLKNDKIDKESRAKEVKTALDEQKLREENLQGMYAQMRKEDRFRDLDDKKLKLKILLGENSTRLEEKKVEEERLQDEMNKILNVKVETAKKNGGKTETVEKPAGVAGGGGGKVESTAPILDSSNILLTSIESHLDFIRDNTESTEDRKERMRAGGGAAAAGGEVAVSEEDGDGFGTLLTKFLIGVGAAVAGLAAGAAVGVVTYLTDIVKMVGKPIIKFIDNIKPPQWLDDIIKSMKDVGGGVFTKIKNFFTGETSVFKRIGKIIDPVIDAVKGFGGGIFDSIKNVFKSLGGVGDMLMSPINAIMDFFPGGGAKSGGGIIDKILGFLKPFKGIFTSFAKLGAKLIAPLNIIMGIFDAGFEAKDAVEKSDGFFASLFNGIIGAIGGFIDGALLSLLDLIKDGVAWVAGFLGFKGVEESLNAFSFSKIFNEMLDKVYIFFNELFNFDLAAMASSLIPEDSFLRKFVPESLFQSSEKAVEKGPNAARGGFIVNQPTYLPNSGVVVGEHGTYSGRGAAYGGIADGGAEAVIPLGSTRASAFIDPMAQSISGQVMNQLQMERMSDGAGGNGSNMVTGNDMSSNQVSNNTTNIINPSPIGPKLPDEGRDFVSKVA